MKRELVYKLYLDLWQTTHLWLSVCGSQLSRNSCKEEITKHPKYPSLLSVIDFLDIGGMGYKAAKADASNVEEFNYPFPFTIQKTMIKFYKW
jgi:hypothetical protein